MRDPRLGSDMFRQSRKLTGNLAVRNTHYRLDIPSTREWKTPCLITQERSNAPTKAQHVGSQPAVLQHEIVEDAVVIYFSKSELEDEIGDFGPPYQHIIL